MALRLLFPICFILGVTILLFQSLKLPVLASNGVIGPGFLPMVLALLIITLLAIEGFSVFWNERKQESQKEGGRSSIAVSTQLFFLVAIVLTLALVYVVGMLISLGLFIFVILNQLEKRTLFHSSVFSIVSILVIYVIFDVLLGISFASGMLS
ncbi:tripartite tricarboxylate transporter TctB family protein [Alkalihalophilus lindianensis]|uniref:Tripartite tricarboxylate transporter TctB family protein n=1 Tax=Alkalihalophilus lindianensis TaxID=1630542 RepID=A0ABU3XD86_9BACI|nr:tripartite tricarboxylate transporter TctB family protein [Alkalihalophilus lindianensis]MDV2685592.1 tripartite tricarboxylate transporter TctB family protein [Alkalihalophilus lindianensis]